MARAREFNEQAALERAMTLFWHKGYAETSVRDLVAFTGVAHAGLYKAFGGKEELYQAALRHYDTTFGNMLFGPLEAENSGRADIERFFAVVLDAVKTERFGDGCFMCNTAVEFGNTSAAILESAKANITRMSAAFRGALARAVENGEVRPDLDPDASADFLVNAFHGISVLARCKSDHGRIENAVRLSLDALE